jgi:hypothetical protein
MTRVAYGLWVTLFVSLGLELIFRIIAFDPAYYWQFRFQFVSPNSYVNRADGVWTYRPSAAVREVAIYGVPSPVSGPKLTLEFDCRMRSNNLGLLQDEDIPLGTPQTIVIGDSFTSGQGGCPWFHKLQARHPRDQLLNAGLPGTGFDQWWRLLEYLRNQGVVVKQVLIIAISNDFKRTPWNWSAVDLNCIDRGVCTTDVPYSWQQVRSDETQNELIARTRERYTRRFSNHNPLRFWYLSLEQHSLFLKFVHIAVDNLSSLVKSRGAGVLPGTETALEAFKTLGVPIKVLMVTQRNETGMLGNEADATAAAATLRAHGLPYDWCRLSYDDYLTLDGHPTSAGYDKLVACADRALSVN